MRLTYKHPKDPRLAVAYSLLYDEYEYDEFDTQEAVELLVDVLETSDADANNLLDGLLDLGCAKV